MMCKASNIRLIEQAAAAHQNIAELLLTKYSLISKVLTLIKLFNIIAIR